MLSKLLKTSLVLAFTAYGFNGGDITGNWKLNTEKSKGVRLAGQTMSVKQTGTNTYLVSGELINSMGEKRRFEFTRVCDGRERPLEGKGVPPDTVETCNAQTLSGTSKMAGGPTSEMQITFSPDGKSHTVNVKRTMPDGKKVEEAWVYDRQ